MIETILFVGGIFTAWTLLGLVCAERYRRLRQIEDKIEAERAAEAAARLAEAADAVRRKMWMPANAPTPKTNASAGPKPDVVLVEPPAPSSQAAPEEDGRAAA